MGVLCLILHNLKYADRLYRIGPVFLQFGLCLGVYEMNLLTEVIKLLIQEKRDSDEPSFMIALYPSNDTVSHILSFRDEINKIHDLSSMRELAPEELHATIRWWKADDGGDYNKIAISLEQFELNEPIEARVTDVDVLGDSLSLMLDSIEMQELYEKIDNLVQGHGGPPSTYPQYRPHISMFYGDWDKVVSDQVTETPEFSIFFDRLTMVDGNDNVLANVTLESVE